MCTKHMIIQCAMTFPHIACQLRLLTWHSSFSFFLKVHSAKMTIPLPCMQPASMHTKALAGHHAQPRSCSLPRAHRTSSTTTRRQGKHICHAAKGNGKAAIQGEGVHGWHPTLCNHKSRPCQWKRRCHIHVVSSPTAAAKPGLVPKIANLAIALMCTLRAMPSTTSAAAMGRAGCQRCPRSWLTV